MCATRDPHESERRARAMLEVDRFLQRSRLKCAYPTLIRAVAGDGVPDPSPNPACCGHSVPVAGLLCPSASFSPPVDRPHATRPSADRVRPDWNDEVSRSAKLGARRHETGLREPPQRDKQLAGERHDHHSTDASPGSGGAFFEPLAKRAVGLMAQPAPRYLDEEGTDPGRTVAADPLIALHVPACPRGRRQPDPARELTAVAC